MATIAGDRIGTRPCWSQEGGGASPVTVAVRACAPLCAAVVGAAIFECYILYLINMQRLVLDGTAAGGRIVVTFFAGKRISAGMFSVPTGKSGGATGPIVARGAG